MKIEKLMTSRPWITYTDTQISDVKGLTMISFEMNTNSRHILVFHSLTLTLRYIVSDVFVRSFFVASLKTLVNLRKEYLCT